MVRGVTHFGFGKLFGTVSRDFRKRTVTGYETLARVWRAVHVGLPDLYPTSQVTIVRDTGAARYQDPHSATGRGHPEAPASVIRGGIILGASRD